MNEFLWPYNSNAMRADDGPIRWDRAALPLNITKARLSMVSLKDWTALKAAVNGGVWARISQEEQDLITTHVEGRTLTVVDAEPLTPVTITTMAARSMELENTRASIPVESLMRKMLVAIDEGHIDGLPIQTKDRIDMMKFLINKSMPDAKGVDMDDRSQRFDMKKRKAADFGVDELKKLTKEELLELLNS